ncbi:broad specificity phosphatase PhoE [Enterococcus sp. PF1-24]|uniref:histidine phosphatase family protein n=1 Tax=unclassified Enterococcus TaxID=2608891 RepID=UPI002475C7E2|nr:MULTISPECIES: histidine phosphatase family protein [unclassified Enterococcus]MDH6364267.1 broad specificity phosphatase PhoE [Enterococcus sp. PFB1-1]MDH6401374.1 broad specificity phosphatase PhoE [Enterococcus sp. PF1-24]
MKRLYLMRHGQTQFNMMGKIQGACDSPLTDLGISQAQMAKAYFVKHKIVFDAAYSSTQERAVDTAEIVCDYLKINTAKGLKEWNFGLFEGESELLNPKIKEGETSYGDFFVVYGGESSKEVQERINNTITNIFNERDGEEVLCVSHGGAMYRFIQKWLSQEQIKEIKFSNCCILIFDFADEKFHFVKSVNPVR